MKKLKRCNGFTFIELLIAITIVCIIAVITYNSLQEAAAKKKARGQSHDHEQSRVSQQTHSPEQMDGRQRFTASGLARLDTPECGYYTYMILTDSEGGAQYLLMSPGKTNQVLVPITRRVP